MNDSSEAVSSASSIPVLFSSGMRYAVLGMVSRCIMWHSAKSMHGRARPDDALSLMEQASEDRLVRVEVSQQPGPNS